MRLTDRAKRICIYFIYDGAGVVDDYILFQLEDMHRNVDHLHCVVNGTLTEESRRRVLQYADEVYERENRGNDIGAYKAAIEKLGWERLEQYDELVLMNFTCFGPVYPFREVFDWAAQQDADFWALTWGEKIETISDGAYLHRNECRYHYQSYFLTIRRPLLGSELLRTFFYEIPWGATYWQSGHIYEYAFPGYFEERGYHGAVYCNGQDRDYPLLHDPLGLMRQYRMPLFKKRSFFHQYTDFLRNSAGEATQRLMDFLENETDYDTDLVWQSMLRTKGLADIVRCAQLNRVLSDELSEHRENDLRIGAVYHAYYPDQFDTSIAYLKHMPSSADILFTTDTEEKKRLLEEKLRAADLAAEVELVGNRGRDVSALLVGGADFVKRHDLICFAHDKKSTQIKPEGIARGWSYKLHENMLGSRAYVENVIDLFEKEKRLGIAFPSAPNHGPFTEGFGNGWGKNFENTKQLLQRFGVKVGMNPHTLCVAPMGTCFWFRTDALKKLFAGAEEKGWSYEDFPCEPNGIDGTLLHAVERAYAYFAQDAGYYPVYLYNSRYTQIELTNLELERSGSTAMRAWMECLTALATGQADASVNDLPDWAVIQKYCPSPNCGIKWSLSCLSTAISLSFPGLWKLLWPLRKLGKLAGKMIKK